MEIADQVLCFVNSYKHFDCLFHETHKRSARLLDCFILYSGLFHKEVALKFYETSAHGECDRRCICPFLFVKNFPEKFLFINADLSQQKIKNLNK